MKYIDENGLLFLWQKIKSTFQTETQVSTAISNALANITGISFSIVTTLPSTGEPGVIYLKSNGGSTSNIYDEYIYVNGKFEKIGTTDIDLSEYIKLNDLTTITNGEIDEIVK